MYIQKEKKKCNLNNLYILNLECFQYYNCIIFVVMNTTWDVKFSLLHMSNVNYMHLGAFTSIDNNCYFKMAIFCIGVLKK
ncbi:MAG: hypothetical protein EXX96DRAFT_569143 [Benjaminiella poitrasii]|nr:MAG: hypothetical protein EXX96DRAFT_569143 [Benjaminiella poitrasii]